MEIDSVSMTGREGPYVGSSANIDDSRNSDNLSSVTAQVPSFGLDGTQCRRAQSSHTLEEIYEALNEDQRCRKLDVVDAAQIDPLTKRIQLLTNKTNIGKNHGFTVRGKIYLCPEEALYFLETLKLQLFLGNVPISVQRARSLLLNAVTDRDSCVFDGTSAGFDEYTVYKHLAQQGYRPRRAPHVLCELEKLVAQGTPQHHHDQPNQDMEMESDSPKLHSESAGVSPGRDSSVLGKRKHPVGGESPEKRARMSEDDPMDNGGIVQPESRDVVLVDKSEVKPDPETVLLDSSFSSSSASTSTSVSDEPIPSTSRGPEMYTVTEVDSDVEFVEEVCGSGVEIQEISSTQNIVEEEEEDEDFDELPDIEESSNMEQPTTKSHVLVDLVSSEDDDESEQSLKQFSNSIWSHLVPKSNAKLGLPPTQLLPEGISRPENLPSTQPIPEDTDVDLEEIPVEQLHIDTASNGTPARNQAQTWVDWRNQQASESFNVFNNSLFGSFTGETEPPTVKKLHLWNTDEPRPCSSKQETLRQNFLKKYKFDLYPPTENKLARSRLERPAYRVIIVRELETLPSLNALAYPEDHVPFLIAVVNEDQDVNFLLPGNNSGIPNLFAKSAT